MKPLFISLLTAFSLSATAQTDTSSQTIDEFGNYFIQDFEDASTYPLNQSTEEQRFVVEGQGEWLYKGTYQSTNTNYNTSHGSQHGLYCVFQRMAVIMSLLPC